MRELTLIVADGNGFDLGLEKRDLDSKRMFEVPTKKTRYKKNLQM